MSLTRIKPTSISQTAEFQLANLEVQGNVTATHFIGDGSLLTGLPSSGGVTSYNDLTDKPVLGTAAATSSTQYATAAQGTKADSAIQPIALTNALNSYATQTYVNTKISNLIDTAPATLDTLNDLALALNNDPNFATTIVTSLGEKANSADLAVVATSGSYADLTNKPTIPTDVSDLTDTTNLLSGGSGGVTSYNDLTDKPNIPTDISDLTDTTNLLSSGGVTSYNDLTDKPTLGTAAATDATAYATAAQGVKADTAVQPGSLSTVATSGSYSDLIDKPTIPSITGLASETYVNTQISNLVDSAPTTLNTLNELAAALGDDANFATTLTTSLGLKANTADLATVATTGSYNDLIDTPSLGSSTEISNGTSNVKIATSNGDVTVSSGGNANIIVVSSTGVTFNGSVTTGDGDGGNIAGANVISANYFVGNGSLLTDVSVAGMYTNNDANTAIDTRVTKSFVDGLGIAASTAGTVTTNAQPNITSVGTLTGLTVTGNMVFQQTQEVFQSKTGATGSVTHDFSTGSTFYHSSVSANFQAAITNLPTTSGRISILSLVIVQGATPYICNGVTINGGSALTIKWAGGASPTGSANKTDVMVLSIFNNSGTYNVLGQLSSYG